MLFSVDEMRSFGRDAYLMEVLNSGLKEYHLTPEYAVGAQTIFASALQAAYESGETNLSLNAVEIAVEEIMQATPFYWTGEMFKETENIVLDNHEIHINLPYKTVLFIAETPLVLENDVNAEEPEYKIWWWLLTKEEDTLFILHEKMYPNGVRHVFKSTLEDGMAYADLSVRDKQVYRWLLFLESYYVVTKTVSPTRAQRRRASNPSVTQKEIHVVALRHGYFTASQIRKYKQATKSLRTHYWWVMGHTRLQWYPSIQRHKPKWIAAHVKGNLSGTEIEKIYAVIR